MVVSKSLNPKQVRVEHNLVDKIRIENGLIVGTTGNKYESKNPVTRYLISNFDRAVADLASSISPSRILEIGCGEGHITKILLQCTKARIHATDISASVLAEARTALNSGRVSYEVTSIEALKIAKAPDMVVCCEVLEHLTDPLRGLEALRSSGANWYLLSVPREPLWRALNTVRGAYLKNLGNSPGHIQHWSKSSFVKLVSEYFEVSSIRLPIPWTIVLCRS